MKFKKNFYLFILISFTIYRFDCNSSLSEPPSEFIKGILWKLEVIEIDNVVLKPPIGQQHNIMFNDSTITGLNNCNNFSADYLIFSNDSLALTRLTITEIGCSGNQIVDDQFLIGLVNAYSFKLIRTKLYIYCSNNSILIFHSLE